MGAALDDAQPVSPSLIPDYPRIARGLHRLVGWGAVGMALCHAVAVSFLARARGGAWWALELAIGASTLAPGLWVARSARRVRVSFVSVNRCSTGSALCDG